MQWDPVETMREFVLSSARHFHRRNGWFDNDKLAGYQFANEFVDSPPRIRLVETNSSAVQVTDELPEWCAIKGRSGHSSRSILLLERAQGIFYDWMREEPMTRQQVISFVEELAYNRRIPGAIIERPVSPIGTLPFDVKVYVSHGSARLTLLTHRRKGEVRLRCYDSRQSPLDLISLIPNLQQLRDEEIPKGLFANGILRSACQSAEKMAVRNEARFCRYDFLIGENGLVFSEISPCCGALLYELVTAELVQRLVPPDLWCNHSRSASRRKSRVKRLVKARAIESGNHRSVAAYQDFLEAEAISDQDVTISEYYTHLALT